MVGWLAGSLVVATATWTVLALQSTVVCSSPVVDRSPSRVRRDAARSSDIDQDDLERDAADLLPPPAAAAFDLQKRPWGRNNVAAWGKRSVDKRRWGQNMALWGKRYYHDDDDDDGDYPPKKRRWGQKHMAIWGKRSVGDMLALDADRLMEAQKRKWGQKNLALWG